VDLSQPIWDIARTFWLLGLTVAFLWVAPRVRRLEDDVLDMAKTLEQINQTLGQLARAQQVDDLRRLMVADLRPMIADAVDLRAAGRAGTVVGQVTTGGGAAAAGGAVDDGRTYHGPGGNQGGDR
jgi:hypothetical protein